jgi:hypothetical protein
MVTWIAVKRFIGGGKLQYQMKASGYVKCRIIMKF